MSEDKPVEELKLPWWRGLKLKLLLMSTGILVSFSLMVYAAMLLASSTAPSESSSSASASTSTSTSVAIETSVNSMLSTLPSFSPSITPSNYPSQKPSNIPTANPTNLPSLAASMNPSSQPTEKPTLIPTKRATLAPTDPPTHKPTPFPTSRPTDGPTARPPSEAPSPRPSKENPSSQPTEIPSPAPTKRRQIPLTNPPTPTTSQPSEVPSPRPSTTNPSPQPTAKPTLFPTKPPTTPPTDPPTGQPTNRPTLRPHSDAPSTRPSKAEVAVIEQTASPSAPPIVSELILETNFVVMGDIPYNIEEEATLKKHIREIPDDLEFLFHVGDIRNGASRTTDCTLEEFQKVADMLLKSPIPVFIVPGDNEYNDCPNFEESFINWLTVFGEFEKNWSLPFLVSRDRKRPENFYFVYKQVLFIGLNIVGGRVRDVEEWETRLEHNFKWTKMLVETFVVQPGASTVVIIGHADPRKIAHGTFFDPLKAYMTDELDNEIPFFYMNGDRHYFQLDEWMPNFHRIMVEGGSREPPLRMTISVPRHPKSGSLQIEDIYDYERYPS
ncbi:unnamed protein product [Cylindrotheca closterium]|uniref:Calcineurin-like phosphoesterase domain-containing protein n=1 Tax=Cylindrotheca closterium TaxID=2856 RepID=A0AAD2G524_9STRA|nr:unnamed protein product [Cylindrotheca closterium]